MCNYPDTKHIRNKQSIIHLDNKSIIRSGTRLKSHILHHVQHTVSLHLHICAYLGTLIRRIKLVQVSIYFSDLPTLLLLQAMINFLVRHLHITSFTLFLFFSSKREKQENNLQFYKGLPQFDVKVWQHYTYWIVCINSIQYLTHMYQMLTSLWV